MMSQIGNPDLKCNPYHSADKTYIETCSKQLKEQFKVRVQGSPSKRPPPKSLEYGYDIFITKM